QSAGFGATSTQLPAFGDPSPLFTSPTNQLPSSTANTPANTNPSGGFTFNFGSTQPTEQGTPSSSAFGLPNMVPNLSSGFNLSAAPTFNFGKHCCFAMVFSSY